MSFFNALVFITIAIVIQTRSIECKLLTDFFIEDKRGNITSIQQNRY